MSSNFSKSCGCIISHAAGAATGCFCFKVIVPIPFIEVGVLTKITMDMCKKIVKIYGYDKLSGISEFFGVAVGAATGTQLAASILSPIPGLGAGANAIATASLHLITGTIVTLFCELLTANYISPKQVNDSSFLKFFSDTIAKNATSLVGKILRGDISGAIDFLKGKLTS